MAFRKQAALALALASAILFIGCTDELTAPNITDDQPVLPPTNVTAFALTDGSVRVKWDASSEPSVNGYNLYRREVGHGGPKRLNGSRILATQYHDDGTAAPRQYEYRVTAVNSKGKESHWTAVVIQARTIVDPGTNKIPSPITD